MPFAFKDKEFNKVAAFFNVFTFLLTCSALVQPSWFRIKGLHCAQRLSLVQFFTFDEDDDDDEDQINLRQNEYESQRLDFNGNYLLIDLMSCMYSPSYRKLTITSNVPHRSCFYSLYCSMYISCSGYKVTC